MTDYIKQLNPQCGDLIMYNENLFIYIDKTHREFHRLLALENSRLIIVEAMGSLSCCSMIKRFNCTI